MISTVAFVACSSAQEEVKGRPPGVVTSAQEDALREQALEERERAKKNRKARVDEDALGASKNTDESLDVWSEEEDISVWGDEEGTGDGNLDYAPVFEIDGWPYQEPGSSFRLIWDGPDAEVKVYEKPDLRTEPAGLVEFKKDEEIIWDSTLVAVVTPANYVAKEDVPLDGFRITSGYLTGDEAFTATIPKGRAIQLLMYAGNGNCYMAIGKNAVETLCPSQEKFSGRYVGADTREQMQALSRVWWVHFGGSEGAWIPLDNNYVVEIY